MIQQVVLDCQITYMFKYWGGDNGDASLENWLCISKQAQMCKFSEQKKTYSVKAGIRLSICMGLVKPF